MTTPTGWSLPSSPLETNTITCNTDAVTPSSGIEGSFTEGTAPRGTYASAVPAVPALYGGTASANPPRLRGGMDSSASSSLSASTRKTERERQLEQARRRQAAAQAQLELAQAQLAIAEIEVEIARSSSGRRSVARMSDVGSDHSAHLEPLISLTEHTPLALCNSPDQVDSTDETNL